MSKRRTRIQKLERENRFLRQEYRETLHLIKLLNHISKMHQDAIRAQQKEINKLQTQIEELKNQASMAKHRIINLETLVNAVTKKVIKLESTRFMARLRELLPQRKKAVS